MKKLLIFLSTVGVLLSPIGSYSAPVPPVPENVSLSETTGESSQESTWPESPHFHTLRYWAITGAAVLLVNRVDGEIDEEYGLQRKRWVYRGLKPYGELGRLYDSPKTFVVLAGLAAGSVGYGWFRNDPYLIRTTVLMVKSLAISSVATWVIKTAVGRHRPYTNDGPEKFDLFRFRTGSDETSFPSGHTSTIFAMMTVLSRRSHHFWVSALAYGFAGSVAFERMLDRKHWASDVLFGAALGYYVGRTVTGENVSNRRSRRRVRLEMSPLSVTLHF